MEKKLLLIESFRAVLRARYLTRPALADEIRDEGYFHSARRCFCLLGWIDPEVEAAADALAGLKNAIASQSVRLYGRLETSARPADIDPTEIRREGISIFKNELDVWQPSTGTRPFRQLPNYLNVHCYAADIDALIGTAAANDSEPLPSSRDIAEDASATNVKEAAATISPNGKHPGGRPPEYDVVEIKLYFQQLLRERGDPTSEKDQSPGWESIADAMKVISKHMEEKLGKAVPEKTRFREVLNDVLSNHRRDLAPLSGN
jgi:hypothetical protein